MIALSAWIAVAGTADAKTLNGYRIDLGAHQERTVETKFLRASRNLVTCAIANAGPTTVSLDVTLILPGYNEPGDEITRTLRIPSGSVRSLRGDPTGVGARCEITGRFHSDQISVSLCALNSSDFCIERVGLR